MAMIVSYLILLIAPLLVAFGNHMLRKMKSLHEYTSSFYQYLLQLILTTIFIFVYNSPQVGKGTGFISLFDAVTWVELVMISLTAMIGIIFKTMAY
jgi:hypothetical protein